MKESDEHKPRNQEWRRIDYYKICTLGGMLSAGTTHLLITPLDVLKVNMQVNPVKYNRMTSSFSILWKEQGPSAFGRGWSSKFFGYGIQGGLKFGLYEYFKRFYSDVLVEHNRNVTFFLSSASAQLVADVALCPFEAVKVCVQTQPTFAKGLVDGFPKLYASRGISGLYKGLFPLWGRNLPFSMIMFSTFEHSVDMLYGNVIQRRKEDCSRAQQLGVTSLAGFVAGAVGTVISNPADNIVSSLYNKKADSVRQAIKNIGFANLFTRSLPVRLTIVGPVVTLQWFLYDTIKVLSGLPTSGGLNSHVEETTQLMRKLQQID
ncbi:mitochondrial phosphate carrier protein 1, mitochondrial [Apium graveolens]|uniref:mitochondrial phosphate carrier protein 1, mitochondrial n=1 Tax=Apium graveolens TaxID=4045 RepID=UPI003D7AA248